MAELIDVWHAEHATFSRLLDVLDEQVGEFCEGQGPVFGLMLDIVSYLREFGDALHHPREDAAFARLVIRDPVLRLPINRLLQEHRAIAVAGEEFVNRLNEVIVGNVTMRGTVEALRPVPDLLQAPPGHRGARNPAARRAPARAARLELCRQRRPVDTGPSCGGCAGRRTIANCATTWLRASPSPDGTPRDTLRDPLTSTEVCMHAAAEFEAQFSRHGARPGDGDGHRGGTRFARSAHARGTRCLQTHRLERSRPSCASSASTATGRAKRCPGTILPAMGRHGSHRFDPRRSPRRRAAPPAVPPGGLPDHDGRAYHGHGTQRSTTAC